MAVSLRSVVILGATGLVGHRLAEVLAQDPSCERVVALGRRASGVVSPRLQDVTADLAQPETYRDHLDVDCVFCALGTTRKKAGSEAAFRRVDFEFPISVAREAFARGARRYVLVSAVGASATSRIFYNRVKGELEDALRLIRFPNGVRILRPSLLVGNRTESRPGERAAAVLMRLARPVLAGGLEKYRAITADEVAAALLTAARSDGDGTTVYQGASLFEAAAATGTSG